MSALILVGDPASPKTGDVPSQDCKSQLCSQEIYHRRIVLIGVLADNHADECFQCMVALLAHHAIRGEYNRSKRSSVNVHNTL